MTQTITSDLENTFTELLGILTPLTEQQLNTVPFEGSWTAGQVGDHLLKSYGVARIIGARSTKTNRPVDEKAGDIQTIFLNFDQKLKSPDFILPAPGPISKEKLLEDLQWRINETNTVAAEKDLSLTCSGFELPGIGSLTGYELLYFIQCHTKRHIHQLKNIRLFLVS